MTHKKITYANFLEDKSFLQWHLTRDEALNDQWSSFIRKNPDLKEEFDKAVGICENIRINEKVFADIDSLYCRILQSINKQQKIKQRRRIAYSLSTVAAIALLLVIGTFYLINRNGSTTLTAKEEIIGEALPDEHIRLVTGGKTITLNPDAKVHLTDGQMSYTDSTNTTKSIEISSIQTNTLIVPNGKRSSMILPDGSKIWINSGTTVNFPSTFSSDRREIDIEGEIFIEVAKSPDNKPFIVHTPEFSVNVFGTSFNVSAYKDVGESAVVLVTGRIEINAEDSRPLKMLPNEMVKLKNGNLSKHTVDASLYTSWVNGVFIFDDTPTSEMLQKIGRYYNISFDGAANLPDKKITGKLFLSENLDDVLSSISLLTSTEYKREDNMIKLIKK